MSSMARTPKTFKPHTEKELRDIILEFLVSVDNKAAFIGEYKIWHGIKSLGNRLTNYLDIQRGKTPIQTIKLLLLCMISLLKAQKALQL